MLLSDVDAIEYSLHYLVRITIVETFVMVDDSAEEVFKEVLKLNPNTINVYNNLGIIYRRRGKYEMAVRQYKKAIKVNPQDENIYYNLARTYFEWRRWKKALAALNKALKINPDFAEAKALAQTVRLRLEERP